MSSEGSKGTVSPFADSHLSKKSALSLRKLSAESVATMFSVDVENKHLSSNPLFD